MSDSRSSDRASCDTRYLLIPSVSNYSRFRLRDDPVFLSKASAKIRPFSIPANFFFACGLGSAVYHVIFNSFVLKFFFCFLLRVRFLRCYFGGILHGFRKFSVFVCKNGRFLRIFDVSYWNFACYSCFCNEVLVGMGGMSDVNFPPAPSPTKCYILYRCSVLAPHQSATWSVLGRVQSATWAIFALYLFPTKVLLGLYLDGYKVLLGLYLLYTCSAFAPYQSATWSVLALYMVCVWLGARMGGFYWAYTL